MVLKKRLKITKKSSLKTSCFMFFDNRKQGKRKQKTIYNCQTYFFSLLF